MKKSIKAVVISFVSMLMILLLPGIARAVDADIASQVGKGIGEWRLMNIGGSEKKSEIKTGLAAGSGPQIDENPMGQERLSRMEGVLALDETRQNRNASRFLSDPNAGLVYNIMISQSNADSYKREMQQIQNNINGAKQYLDAEKMFLSGVAIPQASHASANVARIVLGYNLVSAPLTAYGLTNTAFSSASAISKLTHAGADVAIERGLGFGVERFADVMCERELWQPINQQIAGMNSIIDTYIPSQQSKLGGSTANRNYYRDQLISGTLDAVEIIRSGQDTTGSLRATLSSTGSILDDLKYAKTMQPSNLNAGNNRIGTGSLFGKQPVMSSSSILLSSKISEISKFTAPTYTISQTNIDKWRNSSEPFYKFATLNSPVTYASYSLPLTLSSNTVNSPVSGYRISDISKANQTNFLNSSDLSNNWNFMTNSYSSSFSSFGTYSKFSTLPGLPTAFTPSSFSSPSFAKTANIGTQGISTTYGPSFNTGSRRKY